MFYNTILNTSGIVGIAAGSFVGGSLISRGRRRTVIISQLIAMFGAAVSMVVHESTLTIGRFLCGVGAGAMNVAFSKLINETIPAKIMSSFAMAHNIALCFGFFACFLFGGVLPDQDDVQANKDDEMWRIIWLGPVAIGIFTIAMTLFVMRLEPVAYCMMTRRNHEGRKHLAKIYRKKSLDNDEKLEEIIGSQYESL